MDSQGPQQRPAPTPTPSQSSGPADQDVHILDRLAVLYRYRYRGVERMCITSAAVMLRGYSGIGYYEAQGRLLIETEGAMIPGLASAESQAFRRSPALLQHAVRILKGRDPHAPRDQEAAPRGRGRIQWHGSSTGGHR